MKYQLTVHFNIPQLQDQNGKSLGNSRSDFDRMMDQVKENTWGALVDDCYCRIGLHGPIPSTMELTDIE